MSMKLIDSAKRKKMEDLVLLVLQAIDPSGKNKEVYAKKMSEMSITQFSEWVDKMRSTETAEGEHFYLQTVPYLNEPTLSDIEKAAGILDLKLHQYVYFKHDGCSDDPVRTKIRVPVGYLSIRRLQQILAKKTGYSTDTSKRNQITGQLSGDSAVGRLADEEVYALKTVGADNTLKELLGPRADNRDKRLGMYRNIEQSGFVRYADLTGDTRNQPSLNYMDVLLTAAGLQSDLVRSNELLRATIDKPQSKD